MVSGATRTGRWGVGVSLLSLPFAAMAVTKVWDTGTHMVIM